MLVVVPALLWFLGFLGLLFLDFFSFTFDTHTHPYMMNSGGWVVLMVIFTAFFFAFTVYRFGNISQTSLLGDSGNHLFFRRLRLVLFAGSGYVALVTTLTIPEFESGVLAIRMGGIVVVLIQVSSMAKVFFIPNSQLTYLH
tara:strand:- start:3404 stop:3826 length:423 start_codon:yes stop_codon:yes gene_type:complete